MRTVTAILVFAAAVTVGSASGSSALPRATFTTSLISMRVLDIGPDGPTIGDTLIRHLRVTTRGGTRVGFASENCRWITSRARLCNIVYDLPTGSVVLEGTVGGPPRPVAITGGTGEYLGRNGQATWSGRTVEFVFTS